MRTKETTFKTIEEAQTVEAKKAEAQTKKANKEAKRAGKEVEKEEAEAQKGSLQNGSPSMNEERVAITATEAEALPTGIKARSEAARHIQRKHDSLNNVLKTLLSEEVWESAKVQNFINSEKRLFDKNGNKRLNIELTKEDFTYFTVTQLLPYYIDETEKKVICRQSKVTDNSNIPLSKEYRKKDLSIITTGEALPVAYIAIDSKGQECEYYLKPIIKWTAWTILTEVTRGLKEEARQGKRQLRQEREKAILFAKDNGLNTSKIRALFDDRGLRTAEEVEALLKNDINVLIEVMTKKTRKELRQYVEKEEAKKAEAEAEAQKDN